MITAEQFLPELDPPQIPEGISHIHKYGKKIIFGVIYTEAKESIYVYPDDWVVYNKLGLACYVVKDCFFPYLYERLT